LDDESWAALDLLARDRMMTFQESAGDTFTGALKKHGRPVDLRAALRKTARRGCSSQGSRKGSRSAQSLTETTARARGTALGSAR
jgi:hypothetical protein